MGTYWYQGTISNKASSATALYIESRLLPGDDSPHWKKRHIVLRRGVLRTAQNTGGVVIIM